MASASPSARVAVLLAVGDNPSGQASFSTATEKGLKREDIINDGNYREDITVNAPNSEEGFFLVPKVID